MMAATIFWFVLPIAVDVLMVPATRVAATEGFSESCERLHVVTANNYTNGTQIVYKNSQSSEVSWSVDESGLSLTTFRDHYLPPPSICGSNYERCNIHITSNYDRTIRVAIFPLNTGIGLVSYNHLYAKDTLVFREQFVLSQTCAYMYFTQTQEVVGYCLDLSGPEPYLYSKRIGIQYDNLSLSIVTTIGARKELLDPASLSNFVFFDANRDPVDDCFGTEDGHVVCLESGEVLDHSFAGEQFTFHLPRISTCSSVSRLLHAGSTCKLVAHCSSKVYLFRVQQEEPTLLSDGNSGQVFVCPNLQFVKFRNGVLSLHTEGGTQIGNLVPFPHEMIRQGDCLILNQQFVFFATLVDGRTLLANFSSSSYRELGESEHAMCIASRVKGRIGLVHNGSETLVYNISLSCDQEPVVIPYNFILANYFSMSTKEQCRCPVVPSPTIASTKSTPVSTNSTAAPVDGENSPVVPSPTIASTKSTPVSTNSTTAPVDGENSQVSVIVPAVVLPSLVVVVLIIVFIICILHKSLKKGKQGCATSKENRPQTFHMENPINGSASELVMQNVINFDQKSISTESGESQGTADLLLNPSRSDCPQTPNLDSLSNGSERTSSLSPAESTPSANTSEESTDTIGRIQSQTPYAQPEASSEAVSVGPKSSSFSDDPHPQMQADASEFHRSLTHVLEPSMTPTECSSPRGSMVGSYQGSSAVFVGESSSHVYPRLPLNTGNTVCVRDHPNSALQESSAATCTGSGRPSSGCMCTPIEATRADCRSYMAGPNSSFASNIPPHPEYVENVRQQWDGRSNESDFGRSVYSTPVEPNNDAPQVQRQRSNCSNDNEDNGS